MGTTRELNETTISLILDMLSDGLSLREACKRTETGATSFLDRVERDADLNERYTHARKLGYTLKADELDAITFDMSIDPAHKRIICDTRRWLLSKCLPKIYGDRLDVSVERKADPELLSDAELLQRIKQAQAKIDALPAPDPAEIVTRGKLLK